MAVTSSSNSLYDYSPTPGPDRLNDTDVGLYPLSPSFTIRTTLATFRPKFPATSRGQQRSRHQTRKRNYKRNHHNGITETTMNRHKIRTGADQWLVDTDPRREGTTRRQRDSFQPAFTWLVWLALKPPSLATMGCRQNEWIHLGWCI